MPVPHDVLARIIAKHNPNELLVLEERLIHFKDDGILRIENFNFYELGPILVNISFDGIHIKNCSFDALEIVKCQFKKAIFEGENSYQQTVISGEKPTDFKAHEFKELKEAKEESKQSQHAPTNWEKVMLRRCPEKLFQYHKLSRYQLPLAERKGIGYLCKDKEWCFFKNVDSQHPEYKDFGCKFRVLINPSQLDQAFPLIGMDLFKLGFFKILLPDTLNEIVKTANILERQIASKKFQRLDDKSKAAYLEQYESYRRNNHITGYLHENAEGVPQWDVEMLKQHFSLMSQKLRAAGIKSCEKPESDIAGFDEFFSFRIDRNHEQSYVSAVISGKNSNPANIPHPYSALCQPKAYSYRAVFFSYFYSQDVFQLSDEFNAKTHFENFSQTPQAFVEAVCLTLQACKAEFLHLYPYMSSDQMETKSEFCLVDKNYFKTKYKENILKIHQFALLDFYLRFCTKNKNILNRLSLSIDFIKDPFIQKISDLFESQRKKMFNVPTPNLVQLRIEFKRLLKYIIEYRTGESAIDPEELLDEIIKFSDGLVFDKLTPQLTELLIQIQKRLALHLIEKDVLTDELLSLHLAIKFILDHSIPMSMQLNSVLSQEIMNGIKRMFPSADQSKLDEVKSLKELIDEESEEGRTLHEAISRYLHQIAPKRYGL